ncbi:MAG: flagellar biosynthesis protein FlgL [Hyphomicrobiales bacterium]|nr:flagellar biosynthesis protein FlgL [Hyphomicrobiales bacterium]
MTVSGIGSQSALTVQSLVDMRRQLDDLQRQLGTGKKSDTYAGVGIDRGLAVGLRAHMSAIDGFGDAITNVGVRIDLAQSSLGRFIELARTVKSAAYQGQQINSSGTTVAQSTAYNSLSEILGLLNTQAGDRYLFSGRSGDQPAVDSLEHIMNGDGVRAGVKQVLTERQQADLGADGLGRLTITTPTVTSVQVAEDAISPFGLKLAGVTSALNGATVTSAGPPASQTVDLGAGAPAAGDTIEFRFTLPDGSSERVTLTATISTSPQANQFTIGATADVTASNLKAALAAAVSKLGATSLKAASAMAASDNFFHTDATHPPQRVPGPGFATATNLVAGTAADTIMWYTGENGTDSARGTATARIDASIGVSYGLRANEEGPRWALQSIAVLAAVTFSQADPNALDFSHALDQRVGEALAFPAGRQRMEDISAELAGAQATMSAAADRHRQTKAALGNLLEQIEGVSNEEVSAKILTLQTRLQGSLQATSLILRTSLVDYL